MAFRAIKASHPDFEKINELNTLLCLVTNPHLALGVDMDLGGVDSVEMRALRQTIYSALEDELKIGRFGDFINDGGINIEGL